MNRLKQGWQTWVRLWDLTEHPRSMAVIRIAMGLVMLWDLAQVARLGLVLPLLGVEEAGGGSHTLSNPWPSEWALLAPATPGGAWAFWGLLAGYSLSASAMKSIQIGKATSPPYWPGPSDFESSRPSHTTVITSGV